MPRYAVLLLSALLFAGRVPAQSFTTGPCGGDEGNSNNNWFGHEARVCELRSTTLPLVNGQLSVSGKNGGIEVIGEERQDIALEARVIAQDSSREEAESLVREVKIVTTGSIHADGPQNWGLSHRSWSVNWSLRVPRHVNAELHTMNGGIKVTNVIGVLNADTTNGGLTLNDLAGDVHATTVNGGLDVRLDGNQWHGAGLVAKSTNGGVNVKAPDQYSAHLVAQTVNGGISVGFPITIQGKISHQIDTNIGEGGATLRFQTVNGGVSIHPTHPI
jgi:Putative adhesin